MQAFVVVVVVVVVVAAAAAVVVVVVVFDSRFNPCDVRARQNAVRLACCATSFFNYSFSGIHTCNTLPKAAKKKKKKKKRRRRRRRRRRFFWTAEHFPETVSEGNSTSNAELLAVKGLRSIAALTAVVPQTLNIITFSGVFSSCDNVEYICVP